MTDVVDTKKIGERIRRLREDRGIGLRELSRGAGLSPASLSAVEKDRSSPTLATLQKILQALDTNFSDFFAAPDEPEAAPVFRIGDMSTIRDLHRTYRLLFPKRDDLRFEMLFETLAASEASAEWETHAFDVGGVIVDGGPARLEIEGRGDAIEQRRCVLYQGRRKTPSDQRGGPTDETDNGHVSASLLKAPGTSKEAGRCRNKAWH